LPLKAGDRYELGGLIWLLMGWILVLVLQVSWLSFIPWALSLIFNLIAIYIPYDEAYPRNNCRRYCKISAMILICVAVVIALDIFRTFCLRDCQSEDI